MAPTPYTILKAFTSSPDAGNPAAVVILPTPTPAPSSAKDALAHFPSDKALARAAREINLPMTAFLLPASDDAAKQGEYALRWFNPEGEAWLCGHATIALSSHIFSQPGSPSSLTLETMKHGKVTSASLPNPLGDGKSDKRVAIDFPEIVDFEPLSEDSARYAEIVNALKAATTVKDLKIVAIQDRDSYIIVEFAKDFDMSAGSLPFDTESMVSATGVPAS
jgi:PhzF family phenazine biosynthesis protein